MTDLLARDLMTADVVTVPAETPVLAMARLLSERGISAVPVLGREGEVIGIVTEADLVRRLAGETDRPGSWLGSLFSNLDRDANRYARTHGATAADVMTTDPVSVTPDTNAAEVARLLETKAIRRVLVIEEGRLCGIVSRADLLRALASPPAEFCDASDERIRHAVLAKMRREPWSDTFYTMVEVKDGVVEFSGFRRSVPVQRGLRVLAETVPGVKGVTDSTQAMPTALYASV